jgi:hypothetical protein
LVSAAIVASFAMQEAGTAEAGQPCVDFKGEICLALDPAEDTNPVGTDHTVSAVVTGNSEPLVGAPTLVIVADGPNAGENTIGETDSNGELSLTYTGDGGVGADTIGALVCLGCGKAEAYLQSFAEKCIAIPEKCGPYFEECAMELLQASEPTTVGATVCNVGFKTWEEAEEEPTPTATVPEETPPGEGSVDVEVSDDNVEVGEEVDVTATVVDENGNPVVGEDCTFSIADQPGDDASVEEGPVTTDENGQATTTLSAGSTPGTVQVEADCGDFGSQVLDVVVSPAALPATGAARPGDEPLGWGAALLVGVGALALGGGVALRRRA